jgi:hypothetical protein
MINPRPTGAQLACDAAISPTNGGQALLVMGATVSCMLLIVRVPVLAPG